MPTIAWNDLEALALVMKPITIGSRRPVMTVQVGAAMMYSLPTSSVPIGAASWAATIAGVARNPATRNTNAMTGRRLASSTATTMMAAVARNMASILPAFDPQ